MGFHATSLRNQLHRNSTSADSRKLSNSTSVQMGFLEACRVNLRDCVMTFFSSVFRISAIDYTPKTNYRLNSNFICQCKTRLRRLTRLKMDSKHTLDSKEKAFIRK